MEIFAFCDSRFISLCEIRESREFFLFIEYKEFLLFENNFS